MIKFVSMDGDVSVDEITKKVENSSIKILKKYKLTGIMKIEIPDQQAFSAQAFDTIVAPLKCTAMYDDFEVHTCMDVARPLVGIPTVWDRPNKGEGVVIGISDTGVDKDHPDLAGRIIETADFTGEGDFDGNGHGTHVATIAVGDGSKSNGKYSGVAPEAKLYMAKGLASNGSGSASSIADGVDWLAEKGVDVISLSLGGQAIPKIKDILQVMCEAAVEQGIAVFVAAGNSGPGARTVGTPGVSLKVITVGASDDNDQVAEFSSRGPTLDGYEKPDIVSPGVRIIAGRAKDTELGTVIDDFYVELSGTSMATPLAAGVGLLLKKEFPNITPINMKARLEGHAKDLGTGEDTIEGEGRIQAVEAITGPQPDPLPEERIADPQPCFLTKLFGAGSSLLPVFRFIREEVLSPTLVGRLIIKLYYKL